MLAHNAARLAVPFDSIRLFECAVNDSYLDALEIVTDMVHETRQEEQRRQDAAAQQEAG